MAIDIFSFLKRSDLCKGCSDLEILELKGSVEVLDLPQNHVLFRKGDLADALYIVCTGEIEIRVPVESREQTIATLSQNAVLGEGGVLTDQVRSATAVSVKPSVCLKMTRSILERLLSDGKLSAYKLVFQIAKILSYRLRQMDQAMVNMTHKETHSHEINQLRAKLQADWPF